MDLQTLRSDRIKSRQEGNSVRASMLTVILSDCDNLAKKDGNRLAEDQDMGKVSLSWVKKLQDAISLVTAKGSPVPEQLAQELSIAQEYAPKIYTDTESRAIAQAFLSHEEDREHVKKNMGIFINELTLTYPGLDRRAVSEYFKGILK